MFMHSNVVLQHSLLKRNTYTTDPRVSSCVLHSETHRRCSGFTNGDVFGTVCKLPFVQSEDQHRSQCVHCGKGNWGASKCLKESSRSLLPLNAITSIHSVLQGHIGVAKEGGGAPLSKMYGGVSSSNMFNFSHFFYKSTNIPDYLLFKCQKFFFLLGDIFFGLHQVSE